MPRISTRTLLLSTALIAALLAAILSPATIQQATSFASRRLSSLLGTSIPIIKSAPHHTMGSLLPITTATNGTTTTTARRRPPVYFVSHGGPSTMYDTNHPVFPKLQSLGREILHTVKPTGIVVFSAHWQSDWPSGVEVSVPQEETGDVELAKSGRGLLYDFYGFPRSYYEERFPHVLSRGFAESVLAHLREEGLPARETARPLDHGVFVPFKIMFPGGLAGEGVPLVTVSLLADEGDAEGHLRLGRAVEGLRDQGIVVVVSGMAVHNLGDFVRGRRGVGGVGGGLDYAVGFDEDLRAAVEGNTVEGDGKELGKEERESRDRRMVELLKTKHARKAHPSWEHLVPIHVGVGAAGADRGERLWTMAEGSMSWAQYRFGAV